MNKPILIIWSLLLLQNCEPLDPTENPNNTTQEIDDVGLETVDVADLISSELLISRNTPEKCNNVRPDQTGDPAREAGCKSDGDCEFGDNGRCVYSWSIGQGSWECTYDDCFKDSDCGDNEVCSCGEDRHSNQIFGLRSDENKCVESNCLTDSDCGEYFCKPNHDMCPDGEDRVIGYFCTTEQDDCMVDSDCLEDSVCVFSRTGKKWFCTAGCP